MSDRRKVVVYDRYWSTGGGGEKYAAGLGDVLSREHDVTLLSHEPLDLDWLGERLALDLSRVGVAVVAETEPLHEVTAGFDLFLNASYRSHGRNGARNGVYVVHFPDRPEGELCAWQRRARGVLSGGAAPAVTVVRGFHEPDVIRWQEVRWTDGEGVLSVALAPGRQAILRLHLGRFLPDGKPRAVDVLVDGRVVARADLRPPRSRIEVLKPLTIEVPLEARAGGVLVAVRSPTSVADDALGNGDHRRLGVPVVGASVQDGLRSAGSRWASIVLADRRALGWLDSYGTVVSNSEFTRGWVGRWWGRDSTVLYPPVTLRKPSGPTSPVILAVGRFIAPGRGHAKQQHELVEAFRRLHASGLAEGWELHLAGGCSEDDRPYLDEVRAAAGDLPVRFHIDLSGAELDDLYRHASIFWHATGLGADVEADPVRAEHFGITTAEAMSAGVIPVVHASGGQPEIVEQGISGFTFTTIDELVAATARLVGDPDLRERMRARAVARSAQFGMPVFTERLAALVQPLLGAS